MAGNIPEAFIEELLTRTDIVEVIDKRVSLKRKGSEYSACCPFHEEKTPSFTVSPAKQFYHCFGCGAHGSAIGFLMQYEGLTFPEAIEELAGLAGVEVPREAGVSKSGQHQALYELMDRARATYQQNLQANPSAISYLEQRGIDEETIKRYQIGFALDSWDQVASKIGSNQAKQLLAAGLCNRSDSGKLYDKFRHRIMFPIHDRRSRVIAFGGRALSDDGPKYLNSPETPLFHKGRELYGMHLARQEQETRKHILVVEGYMDVIALGQAGINNCVATLGTATTADHVEQLFRASEHIIYCFDGDRAGRDAAWKALQSTLALMRDGRQASFLFLPEGEDPDSLVRTQGTDAFRQQLTNALPLPEYFFMHLEEDADTSRIDGRARLAEESRKLLQALPAGSFRELMFKEIEKRTGAAMSQAEAEAPARTDRRLKRVSQWTPTRLAIALLLQEPKLGMRVLESKSEFDASDQGTILLSSMLEMVKISPHITTAILIEHWRGKPEEQILQKLAGAEIPGKDDEKAMVFDDALRRLRLEQLGDIVEGLRRQLHQNPDDTDLQHRLRHYLELKQKLGRVENR